MRSKLVIVSNNPLVWEYLADNCIKVEGPALNVLYECIKMVSTHSYALHTHPISGNARLLHNPFRTVLLKESTSSLHQALHDLRCLETFTSKLEDLGGQAPVNTHNDYRSVDYGLFLGMIGSDITCLGCVC